MYGTCTKEELSKSENTSSPGSKLKLHVQVCMENEEKIKMSFDQESSSGLTRLMPKVRNEGHSRE